MVFRSSANLRIKVWLSRVRVKQVIVEGQISFLVTLASVISHYHSLFLNIGISILHSLIVKASLSSIRGKGAFALYTSTVNLVLALLSSSGIIVQVAKLVLSPSLRQSTV